jgi:hypothetical protein
MERSKHDAEAEVDDAPHLEHRWGQRLCCRAQVRLSTSAGITDAGRIRDISSSGAFIETAVSLQPEVQVSLAILGNASAPEVVVRVATVVRVARDGIGVEWCKTPAGTICSAIGCLSRCEAPHLSGSTSDRNSATGSAS